MSGGLIFPLRTPQVRRKAAAAILTAPDGWVVEVREPRRSDPQNRRLWAMLGDISKQVVRDGKRFAPDDWKEIMLHALGNETRFLPSLNGESFVPVGRRSSRLTVRQMTDLIELMFAFGAEQGVCWSDPTIQNPREMAA